MLKPDGFELSEEQIRKIKTYNELLAEGRELYYNPVIDTLYADLNMTLTDEHLAMCMLRHLDEEIAEAAEEIMKTDKERSVFVPKIAKLVEGKTVVDLLNASRQATEEIKVPRYIVEEIKRLKPSNLVIWTNTPRETADMYVRKKIDPLYNFDGNIEYIVIHATDLQHLGGVLTGQINSLPDDRFKTNIQYWDYVNFLKKIADRIV